jgi:toxin HigB-1
MASSGWKLHPLAEELKGYWAVSVSGNWRLTLTFVGEGAVLVDYLDDTRSMVQFRALP